MVKNHWYCFDGVVDRLTRKKIKRLGGTTAKKFKEAKVGHINEKSKINYSDRISDIFWVKDQWLFDFIWPFMEEANEEAGWKYDISCVQNVQLTCYPKGGYYGWHHDSMGDHKSAYPDDYHEELTAGCVRKLSMTMLLNENYEGGHFEFMNYRNGFCKIDRPELTKAGSIIVFPSFEEHRVSEVTKGTRYSMVAWFLGKPFR